jgi:hypothetical protein
MAGTNDRYHQIAYPQERQVCEGWIYERPCTHKPRWTLYPSGSTYCTYHKRQGEGEKASTAQRCVGCGGPGEMNASMGPSCPDCYDDLSG